MATRWKYGTVPLMALLFAGLLLAEGVGQSGGVARAAPRGLGSQQGSEIAGVRITYTGKPVGKTKGKYTCYRMEVTINADKSQTLNCLVQSPPPPGSVAPQQDDCKIDDVQLFADSQFGGNEICFTMNQTSPINQVNLDIYPFGRCCGNNWNDKVSSYKTGIWDGKFTWDNDGQGASYPFQSDYLCSWIGSYWNDRASTLVMTKGTNFTQLLC